MNLLPASLSAQGKYDAAKILDRAAAKVNISKGATMNFTIQGGKINGKGTIAVKGNKFCARTAAATVWYDGKCQWTYNAKSDEVNIANPSASGQQVMNPYTTLNLYKQGYTKSATATKNGYIVHLVNKKKNISEMYLTIDKAYNLKQVKIKQGSTWITLGISNVRNTLLPDSTFRFNAKEHPDAEIIDLR